VGERRHDTNDQDDGRQPKAVPVIVEEQVESARAEVFRAYVRSREQARRLAEEGPGTLGDGHRRAS
jgi:hypothetical protein